MATVTVTDGVVEIRFTGWERLWTGGRERLAVPVAGVRHVARAMAARP